MVRKIPAPARALSAEELKRAVAVFDILITIHRRMKHHVQRQDCQQKRSSKSNQKQKNALSKVETRLRNSSRGLVFIPTTQHSLLSAIFWVSYPQ